MSKANGVSWGSPISPLWKSSPLTQLECRGGNLFQRRPDKRWSLVDGARFVVMRKRDIAKSSTSDVHLEQAGFVGSLKGGD